MYFDSRCRQTLYYSLKLSPDQNGEAGVLNKCDDYNTATPCPHALDQNAQSTKRPEFIPDTKSQARQGSRTFHTHKAMPASCFRQKSMFPVALCGHNSEKQKCHRQIVPQCVCGGYLSPVYPRRRDMVSLTLKLTCEAGPAPLRPGAREWARVPRRLWDRAGLRGQRWLQGQAASAGDLPLLAATTRVERARFPGRTVCQPQGQQPGTLPQS